MRATWTGYLKIGKLHVPVRLYPATRSTAPHFVQLHAADRSPVSRVAKCQQENKEIAASEVIRAVEYEGGYVELAEADLGHGHADKSITVSRFSAPQAIDPVYCDKPYYVVPAARGELAYALLREAFVKVDRVAVAKFMLYEKEHLGIILPRDGILMLQQLRFADEIVPRSDINSPSLPQPTPGQIALAAQPMERYTAPFYVGDYRNEQRDRLQETIERKAKGLPPKRERAVAPQSTPEEEVATTIGELLQGPTPQYLG